MTIVLLYGAAAMPPNVVTRAGRQPFCEGLTAPGLSY
jgi:hypothetical protein